MNLDILSTSVIDRNPGSPLLRVTDHLSDKQILTGDDVNLTSFKGNPDVYGVQIRKGSGGSLYEYPIYKKGTESAMKWRAEMAQAHAVGQAEMRSKVSDQFYNSKDYDPMVQNPRKRQAVTSDMYQEQATNSSQQTANPFDVLDMSKSAIGMGEAGAVDKSANDKFASKDPNDPNQWDDLAAEGALLAGNIASLFPSVIPGIGTAGAAAIAYGTDAGQFARNVTEDGFDMGDVGTLAVDAGISTLGLVPFGAGAAAKIWLKGPKMLAKATNILNKLSWLEAGGESLQGATQASSALVQLKQDRTNVEAWKNLAVGLNSALEAGQAMRKPGVYKNLGKKTNLPVSTDQTRMLPAASRTSPKSPSQQNPKDPRYANMNTVFTQAPAGTRLRRHGGIISSRYAKGGKI